MDDGFRGLSLTNTLTRRKEEFRPLDWADTGRAADAKQVRMYVCGPTVYDFAHIGNARPVIVFDTLYRLLRHLYGEAHVRYVRNITDVDDKINARAASEHPDLQLNEAIARVTAGTTRQFHADIAALGALPPDVEPRATDHIDAMKTMIETLVDKGNAYVADGHVLFHTPSMPDYGALSGRSLDEMIAGARVEVASYKKDPTDFVLWKPSTMEEPGWSSPAGIDGRGRPGWHIECSAMSEVHLGPVFDIHGGGLDLIFPHHENEIAQSCCAHGTDRMAQVWLHNGFVQVEGRKMSKSEGNFVTINDILATTRIGGRSWPGEVVRLALLKTHYREPLDFTQARLEEALRELDRWERMARAAGLSATPEDAAPDTLFLDALKDDLALSAAFARVHELFDGGEAAAALASLRLIGIEPLRADALDAASLERIAERLDLLKRKEFTAADAIRDALAAEGILLKDGRDAATGERTTSWERRR
ncbi:cysteinyl-tRNA synthetase [Aureimonas altamirensis DSM 21988]|uniref:Cysteine--tRNA ligase n=1 Tax=Aureimonas altamirensis DSM 21988 TaxID=1121026 RepID=A0ABY1I393_9HYPH|nr:cysteine--tRNA ligase [Aureimonas altamirensis]SHI54110.1 cysteinyl-tRNA synthetase [Aureimonas altamirensis DSM 21988]